MFTNKIYQIKPKFCKHLILLSILSLFFAKDAFADNLTSPSYDIKMGTINITGGSKSSASYTLNDTVGQTAQGEFNSAGFTVKAGFQYVLDPNPFSFTISDIDLDYGSLVPGTPSTLTNILTITTGGAYGYTVKAIEDHSLKLISDTDTIPDTSCDLATPCTVSDATPWTDNGRYGFGYNANGTDADPEFVNNTYYRPFPIQGTDQPATVMTKNIPTANSSVTVTYKVNISGSQAAGTYQNGIQYLAIPSF
ncbi:hypothetical protein A2572_03735 [Candidatus Collierbacteria bacterium RIFOXYD1_FULL_40_9]|uniref:Uncharacterized protein n=1 Tax=Candidatus Collierbacteria bacterium RIFOXYD1_FULL_40_9 TaxID=1817731 RepID=A0A1F5FTE9_9BACT|nr:MAG: hypothetical protein A2572_03735 [Candidatus Collierbacteria bacterium RIFOXYD1_FULL_40_9]